MPRRRGTLQELDFLGSAPAKSMKARIPLRPPARPPAARRRIVRLGAAEDRCELLQDPSSRALWEKILLEVPKIAGASEVTEESVATSGIILQAVRMLYTTCGRKIALHVTP